MITTAEKWTDITKILLISPDPKLFESVEKALPASQIVQEESPLAGLMRVSRESFNLVLLRIPAKAEDLVAALNSYRRVDSSLRIILLADIFEEPLALSLTQRGLAEDYLILPLHSKELDLALRKCFPRPVGGRVVPMGSMPFSRLVEPEGNPVAADSQQVLVREITELISSAELGLNELLERICWSAVFLCKARGARITLGENSARVGDDDRYDLTMPLMENGNQIGQLDLVTGTEHAACSMVAQYLDQLIPGLVRLASSQHRLQELANTDALTGLANRRHFREVVENLINRAKQERSRVTLVIFDFDDFKHYNDAYGHGAGDQILRESGMLIKRCIRRQDLAARYGGDEFAVILWDWQERRIPNSEHPRSAMAIMERFRRLLREHVFPRLGPQTQGALTISGGLASFPWDAGNADELIERADQALLEAKRSGKDRVYLVGQGPESRTAK